MVMAPVLKDSEPSLALLRGYEDASPYLVCRGARSDSQQQQHGSGIHPNCCCPSGTGSPKAACSRRCRRHRLSSFGGGHTYSNNSSNLATLVYSFCCICQFVSYLPLLVLRVCFGCQQQQLQQLTDRQQQKPQPTLRTLTGLLLIGLPLMAFTSLPIVGRFIALVTSPPARESRSRASSVSSGSTYSQRSCSICSDT